MILGRTLGSPGKAKRNAGLRDHLLRPASHIQGLRRYRSLCGIDTPYLYYVPTGEPIPNLCGKCREKFEKGVDTVSGPL